MSGYSLSDLLNLVLQERAEGLEIAPGKPPIIHLRRELFPVEGPAVTTEESREHFKAVASDEQQRELDRCGDVRFLFRFGELARFAIAASIDHEEITLQFRNLI